MTSEYHSLEIGLHGELVGLLHSYSRTNATWEPARSWYRRAGRPVLGQLFEEDPGAVLENSAKVAAFFGHYLPEDGPLRDYYCAGAGIDDQDDGALMTILGNDLPGAVQVLNAETHRGVGMRTTAAPRTTGTGVAESRLRFSLAGVQPKLSMSIVRGKLTLPGRDELGEWIVKLPARAPLEGTGENENAVMEWARRAGFDVPECRLIDVDDIEKPYRFDVPPGRALAVRRYDRSPQERVHQEDLAQVVGISNMHSNAKYSGDYADMLSVITGICGPEAGIEAVRRLVFMLAVGNADAHWKNWSLVYPDGRSPALAPMYDQVCTRAWSHLNNDWGLLWLGKRDSDSYTAASFEIAADRAGLDSALARNAVAETIERLVGAWDSGSFLPPLIQRTIRSTWEEVPVLQPAATAL